MAKTFVYVLRTDSWSEGKRNKIYAKYRDAHNEAKRQAQECLEEHQDAKWNEMSVHRNHVSVSANWGTGWHYPYIADIIKQEVL